MISTKVFSGIDSLPEGHAGANLQNFCLVVEGGAFRGIYAEGVLDCLMTHGLNASATIGVSAGAMGGACYVCGQIGRAARINLRFRHDTRYVGLEPILKNRSVIGFQFVLDSLAYGGHPSEHIEPFDFESFNNPDRRFVAVATNCHTASPVYFEKGHCSDIFKAIQASASMPLVSRMVTIDGEPYLDGGCSVKVPYRWAIDNRFDKIVVVRTRTRTFRKNPREDAPTERLIQTRYRHYPQFMEALLHNGEIYNRDCDEMNRLENEGRLFMIAPSHTIPIRSLEKNMERLGRLYYLGYEDAEKALPSLMAYLDIRS